MSAAEKLKALERSTQSRDSLMSAIAEVAAPAALWDALPQIVAVVEAAERLGAYKRPFYGEAFTNMQAALAALDEALQ